MNVPDVPKDLVEQIKDGNCVVFAGAGLSQGAGLPNWTGLLRQMLNWAADHGVDMSGRDELEGLIGEGKLLMVAEEMRERLGKDDFRRFMVETFRRPGLEPTEAHRLIPGINFCAALTSNYDTLLETAYTLEWKKACPMFTHSDYAELAGSLRSDDFYIIKVHGTIDRMDTIILGVSDYRRIMFASEAYRRHLEILFSIRTVLFLGFSLTDLEIMLLLDELRNDFKDYTVKHYALMNTRDVGNIERKHFERNYNIHIIPYTPPTKDDHPEVKAFLSELAEKCKQPDKGKPAVGKLSNVPELPEHFLERPEYLNPIKDLLLAGDSKPVGITGKTRRIGVHGMGGIGKSVLAAALARDEGVRRAFPDGVIWLTVGQTPAITSRQRQLALALGDDPSPFEDEQQGKARLSEVLGDKACLIVLDDVWEVKHAAAFNVLGEGCRMLITTRDAGIVRSLEAVEQRLDVLSDEDALTLLAKSAGQDRESLPDEAREVARRCGNLPLALAMIGAMARDGGPDRWEGPLHRLKTGDLEKIRHEFPDYPYPELLLAIQVSVDALDADIQPRYLDFAVFPGDTPVPEAVLHTLWEPDGLGVYDCRNVLNRLVERSLTRRDESGRVSLHDLQFDYVRKQAGDLKALHERLLSTYDVKCRDGWHTGPDDGYFFQHLCYHLAEAGRAEELKKLLMDFRWMQAKLDAADVNALVDDYYSVIPAKSPLTPLWKRGEPGRQVGEGSPDDEELELVQGAIRLSAHVLSSDRTQLAGQLIGRLMSHNSSGIQAMLKQAREYRGTAWLRPLTASLMGPGGALLRTLHGHTGSVRSVAVTSDGRYAISGAWDNTVKVWDLETGEEIRTLQGHTGIVNSVAVTPDRRYAIPGSSDRTLKVWDLETGEEKYTLQGHTGWVRSVAVTSGGRYAISGSDDRTLKVWDLEIGEEMRTLQGHTGWVNSVAVTLDGRYTISGSDDRTLKVWDLETGEEIRTLPGHTDKVMSVAVTSDGRYAISGSDDRTLKVWDLETGEEMRTLQGHTNWVNSVAVTPDGRYAISGSRDRTLKVWDLEIGEGVHTLQGHTGWVNSVAVTSDGRYAISGSDDRTLKVWDLETGEEKHTLQGHTNWVRSVAVTSDGRHAISGSSDMTLKVWDPVTGEEVHTLQGHTNWVNSVAVTSDGRYAISGSDDRTLKVWDLEIGEEVHTLQGHTGWVNSVALTSDGRYAMSGSSDMTLKVWDLETGEETHTLPGHTGRVNSVAVTSDGRYAISGSWDNTVKVWDLETGEEKYTLQGHTGSVLCVAVTSDGRYAISGSDDRTLKVWNLETGEEEHTFREHTGGVWSVAVTSDGRYAISGSYDRTLKVWDLETGEEIRTLPGHTDKVMSVAVTSDGRYAISGSYDRTLKVWSLETGSPVASFNADGPLHACAVAPDGVTIVVVGATGRVHFLRMENVRSKK